MTLEPSLPLLLPTKGSRSSRPNVHQHDGNIQLIYSRYIIRPTNYTHCNPGTLLEIPEMSFDEIREPGSTSATISFHKAYAKLDDPTRSIWLGCGVLHQLSITLQTPTLLSWQRFNNSNIRQNNAKIINLYKIKNYVSEIITGMH